jgi:ssDNA-binding Zn-finger/Zn-ribbon topoisomerase 1
MALHALNPRNDPRDNERRQESPIVAVCPICEGQMEVVYHRNNQQVVVCTDCHSGLSVPSAAWDIVRRKRESK